jgi:hypothetical protein
LKGQTRLASSAGCEGKPIAGQRLAACDVAQFEREAFER